MFGLFGRLLPERNQPVHLRGNAAPQRKAVLGFKVEGLGFGRDRQPSLFSTHERHGHNATP